MVDERTAYWGERDAARYRTQDDDPTGGDYVVAETLDANGDPVDVLLRWDDTAGEWVSGGPVNMNGSDVTNVGALDADSVSTEDIDITPFNSGTVTIPGGTQVELDRDPAYTTGFYRTVIKMTDNGTDTGEVTIRFAGTGGGQGKWVAEEVTGVDATFEWATIGFS